MSYILCMTYVWVMSYIVWKQGCNGVRVLQNWHSPVFIFETRLIHVWDMTHSYLRHDSFIFETWLIHIWDIAHSFICERHDSFICEAWRIHSHVWRSVDGTYGRCHDSSICETQHMNLWDTTHAYVRHDACICETWLVCMWDMSRSYARDMIYSHVRHDLFTCETWRIHTCAALWTCIHTCAALWMADRQVAAQSCETAMTYSHMYRHVWQFGWRCVASCHMWDMNDKITHVPLFRCYIWQVAAQRQQNRHTWELVMSHLMTAIYVPSYGRNLTYEC